VLTWSRWRHGRRSRSMLLAPVTEVINTYTGSLTGSVASSSRASEQDGARVQSEKHVRKPDIQIAYATLADESGLPVNIDALVGEVKYRYAVEARRRSTPSISAMCSLTDARAKPM